MKCLLRIRREAQPEAEKWHRSSLEQGIAPAVSRQKTGSVRWPHQQSAVVTRSHRRGSPRCHRSCRSARQSARPERSCEYAAIAQIGALGSADFQLPYYRQIRQKLANRNALM